MSLLILFSFLLFADFEQYWQREKHHHYISSPGGHDLPFCWSQWVLHWPKAIVEIVFHQQLLKATATPITSAAAAAAEPTTIISIIAKNIFSSLRPSGDTGRGKPIRGLSPSENQRLDFLWRKNLASCNATFARAFITLKSAILRVMIMKIKVSRCPNLDGSTRKKKERNKTKSIFFTVLYINTWVMIMVCKLHAFAALPILSAHTLWVAVVGCLCLLAKWHSRKEGRMQSAPRRRC